MKLTFNHRTNFFFEYLFFLCYYTLMIIKSSPQYLRVTFSIRLPKFNRKAIDYSCESFYPHVMNVLLHKLIFLHLHDQGMQVRSNTSDTFFEYLFFSSFVQWRKAFSPGHTIIRISPSGTVKTVRGPTVVRPCGGTVVAVVLRTILVEPNNITYLCNRV